MSFKAIFSKLIAAFLIVVVTASAYAQQTPQNLSKKAAAIKRKADTLTPHAPVSVIPVQGDEEFGEFLSNDQEGFTFHDIDRKLDVTFKYDEVRKLKSGYGGYNSLRGRHTDRTRNMVAIAIVLGILGGVIGAATAAKD